MHMATGRGVLPTLFRAAARIAAISHTASVMSGMVFTFNCDVRVRVLAFPCPLFFVVLIVKVVVFFRLGVVVVIGRVEVRMAVRTGLLPRPVANPFTLRVKPARSFVVCLLWNSVAIELTVWVSWIMVAADTFVVAVPCMGAADPAANVAAFRADVRIAAIKLTAWVTIDLVVYLDVDSFVVAVPADGKLQTILSGVVNKSSLVEMTTSSGSSSSSSSS